jgi:hypothetical protein
MDEDSMSHSLVNGLRARRVDVITALDVGMIERSDLDHLEYATRYGRTLYSFNVADYCRLHRDFIAKGKSHSGIILAQQQRHSVGDQMRRLLRLVSCRTPQEMMNHIEFLSAWG